MSKLLKEYLEAASEHNAINRPAYREMNKEEIEDLKAYMKSQDSDCYGFTGADSEGVKFYAYLFDINPKSHEYCVCGPTVNLKITYSRDRVNISNPNNSDNWDPCYLRLVGGQDAQDIKDILEDKLQCWAGFKQEKQS